MSVTATHPAQSGGESAQTSLSRPIQLSANRQQTPRSKFTELISAGNLSFWFLLTAAVVAMGLGALHALEPGHGKTIVAAYLVGSRGTARHAFLLGLIVTVSHTAGVFALGAITLYASRYIVPEQLYPWLGALSGIMIAALGGYMLLRRLTGTASDHSHAPGSNQAHWNFFGRRTEKQNETPSESVPVKSVSLAQLFTLGITGGIIPCPAALVVLLSAFALHRIALGFFLIVAFSAGLAAVLIAFGMTMVYAGKLVAQLKIDGPLTRKWLPAASSAFIALLGTALAIQSLAPMHLSLASISREKLAPFLFVVGLGLVLGMRHSTDADHVVAMSTIVTKQRGMRNAALIGSVWGLGHTITIVVVGALIILFGVEIPPRIGLSMEFSVALMLVLLGILNLTGVLKKITARFSPRLPSMTASQEATEISSPGKKRGLFADSVARLGMFQLVRPLVIGLVHGLAGSAAVALLVLSTIHDPLWATAYLVVFGGGTVVGMMLMTTAISVPLAVAGNRSATLSRYFGVASGMVSLCFGMFLVYQLGFVGGLFTAHPMWTPQ
jgi:high-affinity nickel-transport protein